jgi:hypothetical protein
MGRAAGGGAGRSWGMGKFKKDAAGPELSGPGFVYGSGQTQEDQYNEYRHTDYDNHRRPRPSEAGVGDLKPANTMNSSKHAIILPGNPSRANGPRVTFASVPSYSRRPLPHEASDKVLPRR